MKFGIRAGLGLLSFAVATTFFTGCGADSVPTSAPVDDNHTLDMTINPQTPDVKDKFTKWVDASQSEQKTAEAAQELMATLNKTDQTLFGIYDIYEKDGANFIISGSQLVQLNGEGKISAADRQFLRMPGSNQRVYVLDSESYKAVKETYGKYAGIVENAAGISFQDRNNSEDYVTTPSRMFRDLVINGMYQYGENTNVISPAEDILAEGCAFNLDLLLQFFEDSGVISDLDKTTRSLSDDALDMTYTYTGKIHTPTAVEDFTITIQSPTFTVGAETERGNLSELGGSFLATRGDQDYELDAAIDGLNVYVREDVLASLFQMDLDECTLEDGTPVLMIITDVMDLPSDAVIVEDTGLSQPIAQETEEQAPTNEGATYEEEPSQDYETMVSQIMTEFGFSREKAEEIVQAGLQGAAEEQQRIQDRQDAYEEFAKEDAKRAKEESDSYYMERYGITQDQALGMSPDELNALFDQKHGG